MHYTARVIGNMLDPDRNGVVPENSNEDRIRDQMTASAGLFMGVGVSALDE